jgi:hypothetical protein
MLKGLHRKVQPFFFGVPDNWRRYGAVTVNGALTATSS